MKTLRKLVFVGLCCFVVMLVQQRKVSAAAMYQCDFGDWDAGCDSAYLLMYNCYMCGDALQACSDFCDEYAFVTGHDVGPYQCGLSDVNCDDDVNGGTIQQPVICNCGCNFYCED